MSVNIPEIFACNVFNEEVMKTRLPKNVYKTFKKTVRYNEPLDMTTADVLANAIKEGTTSVQETFKANTADSKAIADSARKAVEAKKDKIAQAMNQATGATAQAETVDPETGEIIQPVTENPAPKAESKTNKSSKEPSK